MCTANRPKPCQANLLSDHLPEIKTLDSAGPVTGGSAYEAGKRKAPGSRCFVKKPSRHQPRRPPPPLRLLYSWVSNVSVHRGVGLASAFGLG